MRCSVQTCLNDTKKTTKSHGVTFHMFPREPNLRQAWIEALGMTDWEPKERSTVCSEHFRNEDFYETKRGLRKIKGGAVPIGTQHSTDDLEAPARLRVCRICLAMDVRLYDFSEHKLDHMYEQLTGIMTFSEDRLPRSVCWECVARLTSAIRFKNIALKSHSILQGLLQPDTYLKIRDIKSVNRVHMGLKSRLIQKIYSNSDYDLHIKDALVKDEGDMDMPPEVTNDDDEGLQIEVKDLVPITEVEVKDESSNEIFIEEFDHFDDDDDKTLSEVYAEKAKEKPKVKKKKEKTVKKVKVKVKKVEEEDDPDTATDRYKKNDVKRRRQTEALDESLFTITPLSYDQQIEEVLKRQESSSYVNAMYKCTICYRGFQIKDRFTAHAVRHSEQSGAYECFICKTRLKTSRALRKHLTAQHTEQYSCKGCPFVTRNRGVAREHERWHAGTKYQCPHCASEFDKLTTYMGHIRIKHVSDFVCELCGYTFVSKKGIDVHKKKKHRLVDKSISLEGPYCDVCEVKFVSEEAHERHLKLSSRHSSDQDPNRIRNDSQSMNAERNGRVVRRIERRPVIHARDPRDHLHEHEPNTPVNCEQCGIQLRDLRLYAQHFRRAHPDKNRTKYPAMKTPCMCEQCGKIFQSMALLKDHMWVHTGEKRFKCDRCTKSFTQKTNLVFHMRVHSATRPTYECPLCGKHFAFFNNRRRHMFCGIQLRDLRLYAQHFRRAHPDKNRTKYPAMKIPCMCEQCGKIFQSMALLKDHMWVHTGEKRFKCDRCTKSFTQKTNLVFHMRVHSATRPTYECPLCGKHFAFFNNRRRHMFTHTGLKPFKCDTCGKCFTTSGEHRAHVEHVHLKKPWPKRARHRRDWKCDVPTVED